MNILIIDDDKITIYALKHSLETMGHTVEVAHDGEGAINKVNSGNFDLIISDIMMPGISGLSLVTVLRTVNLFMSPIIMMSSLNNKPLLEAAFEAGTNDFIPKPFTKEELLSKLSQFDKTKTQ